jgi:uncharacterized phage protein (TIGR01671 family)
MGLFMGGDKMRDIKFRIWDKKRKEMHQDHNFLFILCIYWQFGYDEPVPFTRDEIEIMQYTGLKDKNGKEIYEGDTIIYTVIGHQSPHRAIVEFRDGMFVENYYGWRLYPVGQEFMMEVIGNIYENPELLT